MQKAKCIDDKHQPDGAGVQEGKDYLIESEFMNNWGEKAYILFGMTNSGTTSKGLVWNGYKSTRFSTGVDDKVETKEINFAIN